MSRHGLYAALALPLLFGLLKSLRKAPSRETIVLPQDERVLLLGASSGIGRELALAYAKRGARICVVARRTDALEMVKEACTHLGLDADRVICVAADITKPEDLIKVRDSVVSTWGGFDTLHILAGVPSTRTLLQLAGIELVTDPADRSSRPRLIPVSSVNDATAPSFLPTQENLEALATEARACSEINYVGTVLALATFLPLLARSSRSPAVHHLSSVAATFPAPSRCLYSATKSAGLMAMESARVECEGMGVRFFSLLPGTIDNDFRTKTATSPTGGNCEVHKGVASNWGESLLLSQDVVVNTVLKHLALPTGAPWLGTPPSSTHYLPFMYRLASYMNLTPLGWLYVEPNARQKYGLRP